MTWCQIAQWVLPLRPDGTVELLTQYSNTNVPSILCVREKIFTTSFTPVLSSFPFAPQWSTSPNQITERRWFHMLVWNRKEKVARGYSCMYFTWRVVNGQAWRLRSMPSQSSSLRVRNRGSKGGTCSRTGNHRRTRD